MTTPSAIEGELAETLVGLRDRARKRQMGEAMLSGKVVPLTLSGFPRPVSPWARRCG
jgi:hypothetical protein